MSAISDHLAELKFRNYSAGTIEQRRNALRRFARALGRDDLLGASAADVVAFLDRPQRDGRALSPASKAAELSHLKAFYKWAMTNDLIAVSPTLKVSKPKVPRNLPRPIAEDSLLQALDNAPDRIRPWLYLAAFAGLRACEIAPLQADDLWWHTTPPLLHVRHGKGGHAGTVPIAPALAEILQELPRRGLLFRRCDGQPGEVKAHTVSHLANDYLHSLGIWDTLHSLRHRFGTQVYRASGRDIRQTQELMRHRSIVSTAIYTYVDPHEAAATVGALPSPSFK